MAEQAEGIEILSMESAPPEREGPLTDAINRLRDEVAAEGGQVPLDTTDERDSDSEPEPEPTEQATDDKLPDLDQEPEEEPAADKETEDEPAPDEPETEAQEKEKEEYIELELPPALREQGVDTIEVPKDQERLFRALTNGYMRKTEAESAQKEVRELEEALQNDWIRAAGNMVAAPMDFLVRYAKADPQDIADEIKLYLTANPEQLDDLIDWHARVTGDDREMQIEQRALTQRRHDRVRELQRREGEKWEYKQTAIKLDKEIERLAAGVPEHLQPRVVQIARQELHNEAQRRAGAGSSALIRPDEVKSLVGWLIEPHTQVQRAGDTGATETPEQKAEQTRQRFTNRLEKRKAGKTRPAAGPLTGFVPKKGMLLDDVIASLKSGGG